MGAAASIEPEVFNQVKAEYESKKAAGVSDEELFESMKVFIETKTEEAKGASTGTSDPVAPSEEAAPSVEEAKPVEDDGAGAASAEAVPVEAEAEAVAVAAE